MARNPSRNFREFIFRISPPWLQRFFGERLMGVTGGLMADSIMEGAAQGSRAPHLRSGIQPPDALPFIGSERSMPRYPADTDETYRDRLHAAWDTYEVGGNDGAIISQLNAFGLANVKIAYAVNSASNPANRNEWSFEFPPTTMLTRSWRFDSIATSIGPTPEIVATAGNIEDAPDPPWRVWFDVPVNGRNYLRYGGIERGANRLLIDVSQQGDPTFDFTDEGALTTELDFTDWSRFVVIIDLTNPYDSWVYGGGAVYQDGDEGMTYGSTATQGDLRSIKSIIRKWKSAHEINPLIVIVLEEGPFYGEPDVVYSPSGLVYDDGGLQIHIAHE